MLTSKIEMQGGVYCKGLVADGGGLVCPKRKNKADAKEWCCREGVVVVLLVCWWRL